MASCTRFVVIVLALTVGGCTIDIPTDPTTFNIEPSRVSHLRRAQTLALKNAYPAEAKLPMPMRPHTWVFDQQKLTDTGIAMLTRALEQQGLAVNAQAEKSVTLRLRVLSTRLRIIGPVSTVAARVGLDASFGDGTVTYVEGDNTSPAGATRAFDGAVLFALNQLLADEKFVAYVNR